jgi:hypothetical protein
MKKYIFERSLSYLLLGLTDFYATNNCLANITTHSWINFKNIIHTTYVVLHSYLANIRSTPHVVRPLTHNSSHFAYSSPEVSRKRFALVCQRIISNETTKRTMAYTKKTIAIALIAFTALLCAVIVPTKNSRQNKSSGSSQSTATVSSATSNQEAVPAMLSDVPSITPSAVPSSLSLPEKKETALASDYSSGSPSDIPSKIPTSAPIPLSDYPSIVPSSWGTPEPTIKEDRWLTEADMVHGRRVRALREH